MTVKERIIEFIKSSGLSVNRFEKSAGLSVGYLRQLRKEPSREKIENIVAAFPMLNPVWLMTGEGDMLREEGMSVDEVEAKTALEEGKIPLIPASAFAGNVQGFAPDSLSLRDCDFIVSPVRGAEFAIPITGESMEPDYPDGSIVYIKHINVDAFIPWGNTMVLDTENGAFIKRIFPDIEDDEYIWAKSINPDYPPIHMPKASIFRIFRVMGMSRVFTTM